jgi:flavin-dependent dehydrogenase
MAAAQTYDAVIVGARCAGAALATYLARSGASVIVLEAGRLGTDQVLSTHTIHPAGMDFLDELGVGEAVREGAPPARTLRFEVDGAFADVVPPAGRYECCPRRYRLDSLLQEAALAAGAEVLAATRVTELLRDGGRVVGVRAEREGREIEIRGVVTVGADGRHSTVAKLVGATEYLDYDGPRGMYWAYWQPPAVWKTAAYPYDFLLRFTSTDRRVLFSTDDGQLLIATLPLIEEARQWRSDPETRYLHDLRSDSELGPLVTGGKLMSRVLGTVSERYFFRRSAGPGWALVGDAGHHKDPILGWGISEALSQAKKLAEAIRAGGDTALERYWRQRDVDVLPRFRLAEERAAPQPITPVLPMALRRVGSVPGLAERLFRETEYDANPYELMPVSKVALWTLAEVFRGRPRLILDFIAQGRRATAVQAELKERQKLLDAVAAA